jgi:truncated hemoglobin YjbI
MQKLVRDYEKQIWQAIPVRTDKQGRYDLITHIYWVKITEEEYDELLALFPKTRKDIALYWD